MPVTHQRIYWNSRILDGHNEIYSAETRVSHEQKIYNISPVCIPSCLSQGKAHIVFFTLGNVLLVSLSSVILVLDYQNIFEISTSAPNLTEIDQWIQKLREKNRQTDDGPINLVIKLKRGFFSLVSQKIKPAGQGRTS